MLCKHEALEQTTFSTSASATATGSLLSYNEYSAFWNLFRGKITPWL